MKPIGQLTSTLFPINSKWILKKDPYNLILWFSADVRKFFNNPTGVFRFCQREKIEITEEAKEKLNKMKTYFKEGKLIIENI
jgi:hypothetical protein